MLKNKNILLKENTVSMAIQKAEKAIRLATKKGDLVAAINFKMKLKNDLENAGYNWKQDPYATDLIQEAAKIKTMKNNKKSIEERKVEILKKKLEEATGKKVELKEDEELRQVGEKNSIKWINELKSSAYNLYRYSSTSEKLSKYTNSLKKIYELAQKIESEK